jgi:hypothetical protein
MQPKFDRKMNLAEMLLDAKFHGRRDSYRAKCAFSEDMEATQAILLTKCAARMASRVPFEKSARERA